MNERIKKDLFRYAGDTSVSSLLKQFFFNPGFRFMLIARLCKSTSRYNPLGLVLRGYYKRLRIRFGYQIPFMTEIGGGFFIGHFGNIIINQHAVIGEDCNISQGVTIGIANRGKKQGCPRIGNRVWIGANAVIVGNIQIGDDVLIAPLTFITEDIPDRAVVAGNPAKVLSYEGSKDYVNNVLKNV